MAIVGLRGTGDWGTDERPKNFREMILWLSPNGDTPLFALMARMGKETVDDPEFSWWEELLSIIRLQLNDGSDMATGDTAFVVDNGNNGTTAQDLVPGDLLLIEAAVQTASYADEIVKVTAVASATAFTGTRGYAGTTPAIILDDAFMTKIGSVFEEGTDAAASTTRNPTKVSNFTEIFKTSYSITRTAQNTKARTGDALKNDKKRRMFDHSRDLETAFIWGKKDEISGGGGKPERTTSGLLKFLADASRTLVKSSGYTTGAPEEFTDDVFDVFDFTTDGTTAGDERLALCGNGALNVINKLALAGGVINYDDTVEAWGMKLRTIRMPQGSLLLKTHPLMNRHAVYTNSVLILDPPGIKYRPLVGSDTKPEDNIQTPGKDATEGQWLTEAGIEPHHMETMKHIANITNA